MLLNNAGIGTTLPGGGKRQESEDGYELRFAVNYLAPFLLTRKLLPTLRHSAPARIVNVSSAGQAPIDFRDVMLKHNYDGVQAYCQSKLALVMFTFDLAEELPATTVTANCLHPATYMPTKMVLAAKGIMYNPARFSQEEQRNRARSIHIVDYMRMYRRAAAIIPYNHAALCPAQSQSALHWSHAGEASGNPSGTNQGDWMCHHTRDGPAALHRAGRAFEKT